jgi:hypothetical protein
LTARVKQFPPPPAPLAVVGMRGISPAPCIRGTSCRASVAQFSVGPRGAQTRKRRKAKNMSLIAIVLTLIVVAILLWIVNTYIPMDGKIKKVLSILVLVVVVLWLLNVFGVWNYLRNVHV